jgi:tellurite resistance protein TerC
LVYLSLGLSVILIFIGLKLIAIYAHEINHSIPKIETSISLLVIGVILFICTVASLIKTRNDPSLKAHAGRLVGHSPVEDGKESKPKK